MSNSPVSAVEQLADSLAQIIAVWILPAQQIVPDLNEEKTVLEHGKVFWLRRRLEHRDIKGTMVHQS